MALSLLRDNIIGLWVVTLLYGVHLVVFTGSICVILSRWRQSAFSKGLLIVTALLFLCATAQMICTLLVAVFARDLTGPLPIRVQTYLKLPDGKPTLSSTLTADAVAATILDRKNFNNLLVCVEYAVTIANVLVTDGLLIWRCYMVWGRHRWIVVLPILLLLVGSGVGLDVVVVAAKMYFIRMRAPLAAPVPLPGWNDLAKQVWPLAGASYTIYFVNNLLITGLIAYRIWSSARHISKHFRQAHGRKYFFIMHLLIESGSLYAAALFVLAILCWIENPYFGYVEDLANGLAGIIPTLVIVLVGLNRDSAPGTRNTEFHDNTGVLPPLEFSHPDQAGDPGLHINLGRMASSKGDAPDIGCSDTTATVYSRNTGKSDII